VVNLCLESFFLGDPVAQQIFRFLRDHPGARPDEVRYCLKGTAASTVVLYLHRLGEAGLLRGKREHNYQYWWLV